jgi:hypothetical protein
MTIRVPNCGNANTNQDYFAGILIDFVVRIILALNTKHPGICKNPQCSNLKISFGRCLAARAGRNKRQTLTDEDATVNINLNEVP